MKVGEKNGTRNRIDQYLSAEYDPELHNIKKRVLLYFSCFMITVYAFSFIISLKGIAGLRSGYWYYASLVRVIILVITAYSLVFVYKDKLEDSVNTLITAQILAAFNSAVFGNTLRDSLSYFGIIVSFVFAIQIINLFKESIISRIFLNSFLFLSSITVGVWYLIGLTGSERDKLVVTLYIVIIMMLVISVSSILSSVIKTYMERVIIKKTLYDSITGLPNEIMLERELSQLLENVHKQEKKLAVFGVYLNKLERINHKYGHQTGDSVLRDIAHRAEQLKDYKIYRLKGALFVLIPQFDWNPALSNQCRKQLCRFVNNPVLIKNDPQELNLFLVGTECPNDGRSAQRLLSNLYNIISRQNGRFKTNDIEWFDHDSYLLTKRQYVIEEGLRKMITKKEFSLLIQPKYKLNDSLHGGEFLARWHHPELGTISPLDFIPLLEENGLMVDFTQAISEDIVSYIQHNKKKLSSDLVIAVNINATSIQNKSFVAELIEIAGKITPLTLEIELTEDVFLMIDPLLLSHLDRMKEHNIRIALDDFGTGFSNMSYLQDLNVDTIKIDKRFITPLSEEGASKGIVRALIDMAHSFNIDVVAEGVEDDYQKQILEELGCDIIQGFLYSKPVEFDSFLTLIK